MTHSYTVGLRFYGDQLEPAEVSAKLRLQPCSTLSKAQCHLTSKKRSPYWAYSGQDQATFQSEWASLEEGLEFLLEALSSRKADISDLARKYDAVWWCGHFQNSFDGGSTLSSRLLTDIGSFGVPLRIDNYFSPDDTQRQR